MNRLWLWLFGRKTTEECAIFIISKVHTITEFITINFDLQHLHDVLCVRFFHYKFLFFFFLQPYHLSSMCSPYFWNRKVFSTSFRAEYSYKLFGISCMGDLFLLFVYLFNHLFVSVWTPGYLFYTTLIFHTQPLAICQNYHVNVPACILWL